jgi:hypothetical protein
MKVMEIPMRGRTESMTRVRSQPLTNAIVRPAKHMDMLKMNVPTFSPIEVSNSTLSSLMAVRREPTSQIDDSMARQQTH